MKLVQLFISITAAGRIAYSQTKSLIGTGRVGKTRLVTFKNNESSTSTPDESIWMFTDYSTSDYDTLVQDGYSVLYADTSTGNSYTQAEVDAMSATDYTIVGTPVAASSNQDSFAS